MCALAFPTANVASHVTKLGALPEQAETQEGHVDTVACSRFVVAVELALWP